METFVVEVELPTLYEMGVSPLGEKPHSVTVPNILQYLKARENAGILAGAKLALRHDKQSTTKGTRTIYRVTTAKEDAPKTIAPYDSGSVFEARVHVVSEGVISVAYTLDLSTFVLGKTQEDQTPPQKVNWSWTGEVTLESGKPVIAGATQEEDSVVFLVLVALEGCLDQAELLGAQEVCAGTERPI